jgi:hypothetical protein
MEQTNAAKRRGKYFPEQNQLEISFANKKVKTKLSKSQDIFAMVQFMRAKGVNMK